MDIDLKQLAEGIRTFLRTFDPEDPVEALSYLEVLSAFKEEKEEKRLKQKSYSVLDAAAPEGNFEFNGVIIDKVKQTKTVWNRTGEVIQAEAILKQAKEDLETKQRAGGFTVVDGNVFWQIRKVVDDAEQL